MTAMLSLWEHPPASTRCKGGSSSSSSNRLDITRKYSDDPKYGRTLDSSVVDRRAVVSTGQQRDDSSSYREALTVHQR